MSLPPIISPLVTAEPTEHDSLAQALRLHQQKGPRPDNFRCLHEMYHQQKMYNLKKNPARGESPSIPPRGIQLSRRAETTGKKLTPKVKPDALSAAASASAIRKHKSPRVIPKTTPQLKYKLDLDDHIAYVRGSAIPVRVRMSISRILNITDVTPSVSTKSIRDCACWDGRSCDVVGEGIPHCDGAKVDDSGDNSM